MPAGRRQLHAQILWRSLFLQSLWNFERLQNIGFVFGLLPFFRALYPDPQQRREALLRHIGFFNTHPYMVNMIFSLVVHLEEQQQKQPGGSQTVGITALKNNIAGPLAAMGDTFFWGALRPFAALIVIGLFLIFAHRGTTGAYWLVPVLFLVLFNMIHLAFRYWSSWMTYELRTKIVEIIANFEFQYAVDKVRSVGVVVLLAIIAYYCGAFSASLQEAGIFLLILAATIVAGCLRCSPVILFYGAIAGSLLLAL